MTPLTDRLHELAAQWREEAALLNPSGAVSAHTRRARERCADELDALVAALTPTPARTTDEDDLTRRDKQADLERQPAASTNTKSSEHE